MPDILICAYKNQAENVEPLLAEVARKIGPDNIATNHTLYRDGMAYLVKIDLNGASDKENEATLGHKFGNDSSFDGGFAYAKVDGGSVELETDCVASKTLWYYWDDNKFFASTSQRAIVMAKGSYVQNRNSVYSFLNSGIIIQGQSWDSEIKPLEKNSSFVFNTKTWTSRISSREEKQYYQDIIPKAKQMEALRGAISDALDNFDTDYDRAVLPLSGGYDSRFLLLSLLDRGRRPQAVTWGRAESLQDPDNDAVIARRLANHFNLPHSYCETFTTDESLEKRITRFIRMGEGRIENLNAYMDGFALWKNLRDSGKTGIIRGDQFFGWSPVATMRDVLNSCAMLSGDLYDNAELVDELSSYRGSAPEGCARRKGESLPQWRDRLYQDYMVPSFYAALNYIKQKYVTVYTPFYSKGVQNVVRSLPDKQRTSKRLFKQIVNTRFSEIPIAKRPANIQFSGLFSDTEFVDLAASNIALLKDTKFFSPAGIDAIIQHLRQSSSGTSNDSANKKSIGSLLPPSVKSLIKRSGLYKQHYYLDPKQVALRLLIIQLVDDTFNNDARLKAR